MRPLTGKEMIQIWEWGNGRPWAERGLLLLAPVFPALRRDQLASLTIGQRNGHLFWLRELTFGGGMNAFVRCPECREGVEFTLKARDLCRPWREAGGQEEFTFGAEGFKVKYRLMTSHDLFAIPPGEDLAAARARLIRSCVMEALDPDGGSLPPQDLPDSVIAAAGDDLVDHDPNSEIMLGVGCPVCQHQWSVLFDIVSFVWIELVDQAKRLMREVHTLASAYGWREQDILSISPTRRKLYVEMVS